MSLEVTGRAEGESGGAGQRGERASLWREWAHSEDRGPRAGPGQPLRLTRSVFLANVLCAEPHAGLWELRTRKVRRGLSWERAQPRQREAM